MTAEPLTTLIALMPWLGLAVFSGYLAAAAIGDVQHFIIKDRLNLFGFVAFVVLALPMGLSLGEWGTHMAVGFAVAALAIGAFALGAFGGGDAKMIAAMGFWLGPPALLTFFIVTTLAGGVLSLVLLTGRFAARKLGLPRRPRWLRKIMRRSAGVPYGVALAVGGLVAAPLTAWYPQTSPF